MILSLVPAVAGQGAGQEHPGPSGCCQEGPLLLLSLLSWSPGHGKCVTAGRECWEPQGKDSLSLQRLDTKEHSEEEPEQGVPAQRQEQLQVQGEVSSNRNKWEE